MKKLFGCAFLVFVLMLFACMDKTFASPATIAIQPGQVKDIASGGTFTVNVTVADVNEDGVIDLNDIMTVGVHYLET